MTILFYFFHFFLHTVLMMITTNLQIQILICLYYTMLLMTSQSLAFKLLKKDSKTHHDITRDAILQTTADVCKFKAHQEGNDFVMVNKIWYLLKYKVIANKYIYFILDCVCLSYHSQAHWQWHQWQKLVTLIQPLLFGSAFIR